MLLYYMIVGLALAWAAILGGSWFGWQLLRQNGRLLLRLEELEKRLDELEFGGAEEPEGLPLGSAAPAFELPDLAGVRRSLAQFRGQPVLLIFFTPDCGFCREMMPKLAAVAPHPVPLPVGRGEGGQSPGEGIPLRLIVTTGDAEKNRHFFDEHKVGCPVLLQQDGEVAKAYQANGTPSGYLIGPDGKVASPLTMGAEALLKLADGRTESGKQKAEMDQSAAGNANGDSRANRFGNRSLARSKINRDGLKAGTPAPDFRLPRLDGRGELSLRELRGKRVLLVFSSPGCGPCNALAPELERFHRQQLDRAVGRVTPCAPQRNGMFRNGAQGTDAPYPITVVMISKGEPEENRAKVKEHGLTFPVVLQQQWEISRRYAMFATPIAYLIDQAGIITHDVAVGVEQILKLVATRDGIPDNHEPTMAGRRNQLVGVH